MKTNKKRFLINIEGPLNIPIMAIPFEFSLGRFEEHDENLNTLSTFIGGNKMRHLKEIYGKNINLIKRRDTTLEREAIYSLILEIEDNNPVTMLNQIKINYGISNLLKTNEKARFLIQQRLDDDLKNGKYDLSKAQHEERVSLAEEYIETMKSLSKITSQIYCINLMKETYQNSGIE